MNAKKNRVKNLTVKIFILSFLITSCASLPSENKEDSPSLENTIENESENQTEEENYTEGSFLEEIEEPEIKEIEYSETSENISDEKADSDETSPVDEEDAIFTGEEIQFTPQIPDIPEELENKEIKTISEENNNKSSETEENEKGEETSSNEENSSKENELNDIVINASDEDTAFSFDPSLSEEDEDLLNEPEVEIEINSPLEEEKLSYQENILDKSPSRKIAIKKNQYLDIEYPGKGWIYLGDDENADFFRYIGRKIENSSTVFSLFSKKEGKSLLHFYKNDLLTGNYIDDFLEVTIEGENENGSLRTKAPSYADAVPERSEKKENINQIEKKSESEKKAEEKNESANLSERVTEGKTNIKEKSSTEKIPIIKTQSKENKTAEISFEKPKETEETLTENKEDQFEGLDSSEILEKAEKLFKDKNIAECLKYIDEFLENENSDADRAWFLKGQALEYNSSSRNIKAALEAYEKVKENFPESSYWKKADERASYIKRFYFNIR